MSASLSSRYAQLYASPNGASDGRPTTLQIIRDEGLIGKLSGKIFLITGCSSGIGVETARAIAATGATLFLAARNLSLAENSLKDILEPGRIELLSMDLSSLPNALFYGKHDTPYQQRILDVKAQYCAKDMLLIWNDVLFGLCSLDFP